MRAFHLNVCLTEEAPTAALISARFGCAGGSRGGGVFGGEGGGCVGDSGDCGLGGGDGGSTVPAQPAIHHKSCTIMRSAAEFITIEWTRAGDMDRQLIHTVASNTCTP